MLNEFLETVKAQVSENLAPYDPTQFNPTKYNKTLAQKLLKGTRNLLSEERFGEELKTIHTTDREIPTDVRFDPPHSLEQLAARLEEISKFSVTAKAIKSLIENQQLASWVEHGLQLHLGRHDCGFCGGEVPPDRIAALQAHFDQSYRALKAKVNSARQEMQSIASSVEAALATADELTKAGGELGSRLGAHLEAIEQFRSKYARWHEAALAFLTHRDEHAFDPASWIPLAAPDIGIWSRFATAIREHNESLRQKRSTLTEQKKAAATAVLQHIAATHGPRYDELDKNFQDAAGALKDANKKIDDFTFALDQLKGKRLTSNDGNALAQGLSEDLALYLGHRQLSVRFEHGKEAAGFAFLRNGQPAKDLSEGERNAIALLHFLRSFDTLDRSGRLSRACVVIDDPVSSLDQDAILSAFGFLKQRLLTASQSPACAQFILLTHNFDFFRLWKRQLDPQRRKDKEEADTKKCAVSELPVRRTVLLEFGIRMAIDGAKVVRRPVLREMGMRADAVESQYFFLFQQASQATLPGGEDLLGLTGNATRRLLEGFLRFKAPHETNFTQAADALGEAHQVPAETTIRVVKALHGASHREELDIDKDQPSTSVARDIRAALDFMRAVDPAHFNGMCKATQIAPDLSGAAAPTSETKAIGAA